MSIRKILTFPDERLKRKCRPVTDLNGDLQLLIDEMVETMYAAPGIGLAAPQVGADCRLIVFDVEQREGKPQLFTIVNPEIVEREGELVYEEGCLSVPGFNADVKRNARVGVRGFDRKGSPLELEAEGLAAVVLQHEIDHLDGILFIDRISRLKRSLYIKRLKKTGKIK